MADIIAVDMAADTGSDDEHKKCVPVIRVSSILTIYGIVFVDFRLYQIRTLACNLKIFNLKYILEPGSKDHDSVIWKIS